MDELEGPKLPKLTVTNAITLHIHALETDVKYLRQDLKQLRQEVADLKDGKARAKTKRIDDGATVRLRLDGFSRGQPCDLIKIRAQDAHVYYSYDGSEIKKKDKRLHVEPCPYCPDFRSE